MSLSNSTNMHKMHSCQTNVIAFYNCMQNRISISAPDLKHDILYIGLSFDGNY